MKPVFILLYIFLFHHLAVQAQSWVYKNEFGFRSDNDAYLALAQDRYYTNGLFITFRHAMDQRKVRGNINKKIWEVEAGHRMYNAQQGDIADIAYVDRPFAAYLYAGVGFYWLYDSENTLKLSLQGGTIGPDAKGKEVQELLHKIGGFYKINGWQFQLNNDIGINTSLEFTRFLRRSENDKMDYSIVSNLNLGTTYSGAAIGGLFRAGTLSQFFHSAISNSRTSNEYVTKPMSPREFFFFARPLLNFVVYDATIQGGLSNDNKGPRTFDVKRLVFSQELGAMFAAKHWTADFSVTLKTKEVKSVAKSHQYGSLSLYYSFN